MYDDLPCPELTTEVDGMSIVDNVLAEEYLRGNPGVEAFISQSLACPHGSTAVDAYIYLLCWQERIADLEILMGLLVCPGVSTRGMQILEYFQHCPDSGSELRKCISDCINYF
ncbi:hypothetical protein ACC817_22500 [Rhizobium ruizarguesonis]|uniref:hypothetical protein n=1 Tax=Rhizobium leguminosarum TaxID=384 RepID=UPI003F998406